MATKKRRMELVGKAQAMVDKIKSEHREATKSERETLDALLLDAKIAQFAEAFGEGNYPGDAASTPAGAILGSEEYTAFKAGSPLGDHWSWGPVEIPFQSAAGDPVLESTGNNADAVAPMWLDRLATPALAQEQPTLASLFAQGQADTGVVRYAKVVTRTAPTSAVTVESQQKPGAELAFDDVTLQLQKLAVFLPVSMEMLEDSPQIANYINTQLPLMVAQAEDKKFAGEIYAAATGVGLSATIGGTDANGFDAIADAIKDVQVGSQSNPDGVFINPTDYWSLAVKKSSTAGDYFSGGPYASGVGTTLWGLRVVISQRAPAGFPLIGNFRQGGEVWRRGGIRLETSNSHNDGFRTNILAVRAEVRTGLAVYDGSCFSVANLAS
jgi:HK97 family phage major capsid protein